jgi:hypothetical protein
MSNDDVPNSDQAEPLDAQVNRLAQYILKHHSEQITDAGACNVAINTMRHLYAERALLRDALDALLDDYDNLAIATTGPDDREREDLLADVNPAREALEWTKP